MSDGVRITAVDLGVRIGRVVALPPMSATFEPGRITAVVGPSGSGKSTLFGVLAGQQGPTEGRVDVDGAPLASSGVRVAMVHQAFALLSLLTAAENVELAAQINRMPRREVLDQAARCLAAVGMAARANHLVEELSGGEQQRVAIARSLITEPQVLLADEPTAQLDPPNREAIVALLRQIADDGATVVVATHDAELAAQCDTIVELRATGSPEGRHRQS